jgi:hypothetical protein
MDEGCIFATFWRTTPVALDVASPRRLRNIFDFKGLRHRKSKPKMCVLALFVGKANAGEIDLTSPAFQGYTANRDRSLDRNM